MFQNAQVHQMIMQQLMLSAIPKQNNNEQVLNKVVDKLTTVSAENNDNVESHTHIHNIIINKNLVAEKLTTYVSNNNNNNNVESHIQ